MTIKSLAEQLQELADALDNDKQSIIEHRVPEGTTINLVPFPLEAIKNAATYDNLELLSAPGDSFLLNDFDLTTCDAIQAAIQDALQENTSTNAMAMTLKSGGFLLWHLYGPAYLHAGCDPALNTNLIFYLQNEQLCLGFTIKNENFDPLERYLFNSGQDASAVLKLATLAINTMIQQSVIIGTSRQLRDNL